MKIRKIKTDRFPKMSKDDFRKEPSIDDMRKIVEKNGGKTDGMSNETIRILYIGIMAWPNIRRAEEDSLAGES